MAQTETEVVEGIGSDYAIKYGFSVDGGLLLQVRPRRLARARRRDLVAQERAGLDAQVPAQEPRLLLRAPDARVGRQPRRHRLRQHLLLHQADRESGELVGGPAGRHQGHLGQARHPRGREEVPRRRRRAVRVGGRLPQAPGGPREDRASSSSTRTRRCASTRSSSSSTSGRSSRRTTTSSRRSTRPSGRAARSSTCRRA